MEPIAGNDHQMDGFQGELGRIIEAILDDFIHA